VFAILVLFLLNVLGLLPILEIEGQGRSKRVRITTVRVWRADGRYHLDWSHVGPRASHAVVLAGWGDPGPAFLPAGQTAIASKTSSTDLGDVTASTMMLGAWSVANAS